MEASVDFEPRIVAFLCNWCTYTGADLAGVSRIQYPSNVRPIRVMCSGSVDPMYILKALLDGADGVLVGGCHSGDCHYVNGNYKARRRLAVLREVLDELGIGSERVWFRFISASEGALVAETVRAMVDSLKTMGPNPAKAVWFT
ncbi:MAG: hydrogenase iron-sulfur subunit [Firmicutes bacterium]|nr:hydrogenase iron-sulfur subunit [Bacillota bacterium]